MGTLKVDNIKTESGTSIITNGTIPVSTLTNSNVGMIKLLSTSASAAANFQVDSTYINSTYDNYHIDMGFLHATDNTGLNVTFLVGGSEVTANYCYENAALTSSTYGYDALGGSNMQIGGATGNATGETARITMTLSNVNSTTIATYIHGFHYSTANNGNTVGRVFNAGQDYNSYSSVVNGIKFAPGSGNITISYFKLYGLT
tara:strand:- start:688 stop:1293 length:606 start_codon:yes stop_codon:yes gene_type:complete